MTARVLDLSLPDSRQRPTRERRPECGTRKALDHGPFGNGANQPVYTADVNSNALMLMLALGLTLTLTLTLM